MRTPFAGLLAGALLLTFAASAARPREQDPDPGEKSPDVTKPPPVDDFLVVPLRVHILSSKDNPDLDCALKDADVARIVGKVNKVWHKAGVHWDLGPIVREPAARQDRFKEAKEKAEATALPPYRVLVPPETRADDGLDVYYIHRFPVNGVYFGNRTAFVQETARLRAVPGGIDEPLPRVTAHELGHALTLPHRQDRTNLLASGTTGTLLNRSEVDRARQGASRIPGTLKLPKVREDLEKARAGKDDAEAERLSKLIKEVEADQPR